MLEAAHFLSVPVVKKHVWLLQNFMYIVLFESLNGLFPGSCCTFWKESSSDVMWLIRISSGASQEVIRAEAKIIVWTSSLYTLPETNIAPENRPPQKESSIPTIHF